MTNPDPRADLLDTADSLIPCSPDSVSYIPEDGEDDRPGRIPGLSPQGHRLLALLCAAAWSGGGMTVREVCKSMGWSSTNAAHSAVRRLEAGGLVQKYDRKSRGVFPLRWPDGSHFASAGNLISRHEEDVRNALGPDHPLAQCAARYTDALAACSGGA